ncbi:MAG: hypothetical protein UT05_C0009G0054 [Parcubacteria group bacterium GW2011_GWF2_38_76]|nr:MAG: hypothetical protein UT05_C0009G0054 [Parcubacteria group bacterium GW2011_GWF2_38_76]HBM45495.1 hypothetical protein [Patescibacteria group bacterium]
MKISFGVKFLNRILFLLILLSFFISFPNFVTATESLSNVGIIKSGIWYSKDPFFTGDKVRIYTLVFNGSNYDLLGDVVFDDNGKVICKGGFTATSGRTQEVWCDYTAVFGAHKISAKIVNPKLAPIGGVPYDIVLENNISGVSERNVTVAPKISEQSTEKTVSSVLPKNNASTTDNAISKNLNVVKDTFLQILPNNISTQDFLEEGGKIASATPKTIKDKVNKIMEKIGGESIKKPLTYVLGFLVIIYNFVINEPILLIFITVYLFYKFAKYIRRRLV